MYDLFDSITAFAAAASSRKYVSHDRIILGLRGDSAVSSYTLIDIMTGVSKCNKMK